jgi:GTP:adenosylcobinamide-phosphate guanylyltransferase
MSNGEWTAIVLAGQRPGPDALATHFGKDYKALVPVGGEPMITKVVRALHCTPEIGKIVILSQVPEKLINAVETGGGAIFHASGAGISSSIKAIAGSEAAPWPLLVTTADHPLLEPAMISAFLAESSSDLSVAMVEKSVMLKAYPDAVRTWLKFSDGHWSGANLFGLRTERVAGALDLWSAAEQDRKTAWKLFLHFGPWLALRAITRTIGLRDALAQAGRKFGLSIKLVSMTDPIACIDVDKVADHKLAEDILTKRRYASKSTLS